MGVSTTTNRVTYVGDGVTVAFAFGYYFSTAADIVLDIYDTLLGGVTNPAFTISGMQNAQGIYTSGGTVNLTSYVPLVTDIIVVYRDPSRVQNYTLIQNGLINSAALVNQLDYMTLLIQRLEDQVSRAILLPDGMGPAFTSTLPTNTPLNPNTVPTLNNSANGWVLTSQALATPWQKATIGYAALSTAGTTLSVNLFTLLPGYTLIGIKIKHSAVFSGSAISAVTASIGIGGDHNKFIDNFDVHQSVGDANFDDIRTDYLVSWTNNTSIVLTATSTGANLSALTQGSVDVFYLVQKVLT